MTRINKRYGWYYVYTPKEILISRLSQQLSLSKEEIRRQIQAERNFIIDNQQYF